MRTKLTVNAVCAQSRHLMLYVNTKDSECCNFTQQTVDSVSAHN